MSKIRDIVAERFGRLVVTKLGKRPKGSRTSNVYWTCRCDCGGNVTTSSANLRAGVSKSCGCLQRELSRARQTGLTHGQSKTPTYNSWRAMWDRCTYPSQPGYNRYGGRGITICKRWERFENFLADMGERPSGMTIDRKDNDGNYTKSNCRWATREQQSANRSK